jgi:hypothetical protein
VGIEDKRRGNVVPLQPVQQGINYRGLPGSHVSGKKHQTLPGLNALDQGI